MMDGIRAVVFDAVGTLLTPEPSAAEVYAEVGRRFGSRLDLPAIRARFRAAFAQEDERDRAASWRTDPAREERRWRAIVAHTLPDVGDRTDHLQEFRAGRRLAIAGKRDVIEPAQRRGRLAKALGLKQFAGRD